MTYQLLFLIMAVICSTNFQHGRTDDVNDDFTCVMKYQNWESLTSLTVNWTIPAHTEDLNDLIVNITWYTIHNIGSCSETRLTSCTWYYGHAMSPSFNFNINVSVIITAKTTKDVVFNKEWEVDPDSCRRPPSVGHVQAESINSTCVNMSWWYEERSKCSTFDSKFYQISYGTENQTEFKIYDPKNTTLVTACNTSRIICNLKPFTTYVFSVQVKLGDWRGHIRGHFSDRKLATIKTPEDGMCLKHINPKDMVHVLLKVHESFTPFNSSPRDYLVGVLGPSSKSGANTIENANRCTPIGFNTWIKDTCYVVIQSESSITIETEHINIHRAFVAVKPLMIESTLSDPDDFIREVKEESFKVKLRPGPVRKRQRRSKEAKILKPQKVPVGAPDMARGGFSVVENKCATEYIRTIRIYWKDVPGDQKHGIIKHFLMDIEELHETHTHVTKTIQGQRYNYLVTLGCNKNYTIKLKAETSVGVSSIYSSLSIPDTAHGSQSAIKDVIPVTANESFRVHWLEYTEGNSYRPEEYRVFWCLKGVDSRCMSPINWTTVPSNSSYAIVPVQHVSLPHNYRFGVGYDDIGIMWADCHYTQTEDMRAPVGLRLESHDASTDGSMTFYWDNESCESHPPGPYIHQFAITFCKVKDRNDKTCRDKTSKTIVDGKRNSYIFTNLDSGAVYMACIQTLGTSRKHLGNSSCVNGQPTGHRTIWSSPLTIVVCGIVAFILLSCAIYGGVKCNKHLLRKWRVYKTQFRITIPHDQLELVTQRSSSANESGTALTPLLPWMTASSPSARNDPHNRC